MNLLKKINELLNLISEKREIININKLSLKERVINAGFIHEGNDYLGLYYGLLANLEKPKRKRDPMFNELETWIPSLEFYINLLTEQNKFLDKICLKQLEGKVN